MDSPLPEPSASRRKDLSKDCAQFLANLLHEIRSPANAVFGFAELINEEELNEESRRSLNLVRSHSRSLLELMDTALNFAHLGTGKLKIQKSPIALQHYLEEIPAYCKLVTREKPIEVSLSLGEQLPAVINSDPYRLRQVLVNLVENAARYTEEGTIQISGDREPDDRDRVEISIIDTGIGVDVERLKEVFRESGNNDPEFLRKYGSHGFGLIISRRLISMMGGEIVFDTQISKGTRFTVSLPIE